MQDTWGTTISEAQAAYDALSPDAKAKIRCFADQWGRNWKSRMRNKWMNGSDLDCYAFRQLRNVVGPSKLAAIKI